MFRTRLAIKKGKGNVGQSKVVHENESGENSLKYISILASLVLLPFVAAAQVTNVESEGNLAPTHDVQCVTIKEAKNQFTPADLAVAVVRCGKQKQYDKAIELFILMQLRSVYDTKRVEDRTAHQAGQVLALQIRNALGKSRMDKIAAANDRFGGNGSPRHNAFCAEVKRTGPPNYHPTYMIQHGMSAFTGRKGNGIVKGFRPQKVWSDLLANYMKCG